MGRQGVDLLGRALGLVGLGPQRIDPEWVIWMARKRTGLSDLGVVEHPGGLSEACRSISAEAGLGAFGRLVVGSSLVMGAANRLRYVAARGQVPQRFAVPLRQPIFVVGLPRSGTTYLQRLLCAGPGTRGIPIWEARQPIASRRDRRRASTAWEIALLQAAAPEVMAKHAFELDSPEEAINLFEASLGWSPFLWRIAGCHRYVEWMLEQDARESYSVFIDLLRWIAAPSPDLRLVLKTPGHLGYLDIIHAHLPQAVFVRTHRDPAKCVASYASLSATMHGVSGGTVDHAAIGRTSLQMWTTHAARAARARVPVIDVEYDELVGDPIGTVSRIYAAADLQWTRDVHRAVEAEIARRPAGRHGKHVYAAEDYGLSDALIRRRYEQAVTEASPL